MELWRPGMRHEHQDGPERVESELSRHDHPGRAAHDRQGRSRAASASTAPIAIAQARTHRTTASASIRPALPRTAGRAGRGAGVRTSASPFIATCCRTSASHGCGLRRRFPGRAGLRPAPRGVAESHTLQRLVEARGEHHVPARDYGVEPTVACASPASATCTPRAKSSSRAATMAMGSGVRQREPRGRGRGGRGAPDNADQEAAEVVAPAGRPVGGTVGLLLTSEPGRAERPPSPLRVLRAGVQEAPCCDILATSQPLQVIVLQPDAAQRF